MNNADGALIGFNLHDSGGIDQEMKDMTTKQTALV